MGLKRVLMILPAHFVGHEQIKLVTEQLRTIDVELVVLRIVPLHGDHDHIYLYDLDKLESGQVASVTEALDFTESAQPRAGYSASTPP